MTIKFTIETDDKEEIDIYMNASNYRSALHRIAQEVFRPHRKHGYSNKKLEDLIENSGAFEDPTYGELSKGSEIISILEKMFYEIIEEEDISL